MLCSNLVWLLQKQTQTYFPDVLQCFGGTVMALVHHIDVIQMSVLIGKIILKYFEELSNCKGFYKKFTKSALICILTYEHFYKMTILVTENYWIFLKITGCKLHVIPHREIKTIWFWDPFPWKYFDLKKWGTKCHLVLRVKKH